MTDIKKINTPLNDDIITSLKACDSVSITGYIYTGRDDAHKRLIELTKNNQELSIEIKGQIIYYIGPAPAKPGYPCGSAGPTTSYRMDPYTPTLLNKGLKGMIGKGFRSPEVIESMKKNRAVYFVAIGGTAALISKSIRKSEVVAYENLGAEAIYRFYVKDFFVIVFIDSSGYNIYETEPPKYRK